MILTDEHYMRIAIETGKRNIQHPFAALLVDRHTETIVATGLNAADVHPLRHGEMDAIEKAAATDQEIHWSGLTLYSTAEPCCMCQAAILWCGISEVVYGTRITTLRRLGRNQFALNATDIVNAAPFRSCSLRIVLEAESDRLFVASAKSR